MDFPAEPKPERITAVIDTREQTPLTLSPLLSMRATLTTGDYSVRGLENVIAIERKSLSDLVSCLGWIAQGVPIVMAGSHEKAGEYVAKMLYIAARRRWRENRIFVTEVMIEGMEPAGPTA